MKREKTGMLDAVLCSETNAWLVKFSEPYSGPTVATSRRRWWQFWKKRRTPIRNVTITYFPRIADDANTTAP